MREGLKSIEITERKKEGMAATTYNGKRVVFWEGLKWLTLGAASCLESSDTRRCATKWTEAARPEPLTKTGSSVP